MELLFALFATENELTKNNSIVSQDSQRIVSDSKPGTSLLTPLFATEMAPVSISMGREPVAIVPPILSPSKQQNRGSLISKPIHGGEEIRTPVLLLPSQIFLSSAEGNIVLCKNEGSLSADREPGKDKCHPDTINRFGWHFVFLMIISKESC